MARLVRPVAAPTPETDVQAACPECGTPITGIATTEPGVHAIVDCGHPVSGRLSALTAD